MTACVLTSFSRLARPIAVIIAALTLAAAAPVATAQDSTATRTGRIAGRILDAKSGLGLSDVGIQVVGTMTGTMSGIDGRYSLNGLAAGTVTLHVRRIGYRPKTVTGIFLVPGAALEQNVSLEESVLELTPTVITADAERGSVAAALDAQRTATGVVNSVTSEQISRSPDSDAAQAVQRVSGVTVQDGKYVFARGVGERYTTTSLNGARLPSPEPERKVVPLDLFPASLLQSVTTSKTFTPDQPGDFAGAQVDLRTREFPAQRQVTYSTSIGYNSRATGATTLEAPSAGVEWLGFGGSGRDLPGIVRAAGNFNGNPSQTDHNRMVSAFRNVWTPRERSGSPNSSASMSFGGNDPMFGRQVGYVGALTYSYSQEIRANEVRAVAEPDGITEGGTMEMDRFEGSTGRASVLWGGLLNLSTLIGNSGRISLNTTYNRGADNEARREQGFSEDHNVPLRISRLRYVERSVHSSQLAGEHEIGDRRRLDWSATLSGVTRREPDRSELAYVVESPAATPYLLGVADGAVRTFGDLTERSYSLSTDYTHRLGESLGDHSIKVGALARYTGRDADALAYGIETTLPRSDLELAPEEIFDGRFADAGSSAFRIFPFAQSGSYEAIDYLGAAYAMLDYRLGESARVIGGARVEHTELEVTAQARFGTPFPVSRSYTDVLPSIALNLKLGDDQNLRFSLSQTLARPEYREVVPIEQRDVLGSEQQKGNPDLERTLIRNADVRWEWYPSSGEVLSVALFAKRFIDPIERVYQPTSGSRVATFENANGADNYGIELEARKGLGFIAEPLEAFTVFSNATLMRSRIDLTGTAGSESRARAMVGQAPYVVNAGAGYTSETGEVSGTLLYNVVGRRVYTASQRSVPDTYEQARQSLDLSLRLPVRGRVAAKLDAKNLLDSPYEVTQGTVTREFHRTGRVFSAGLTWRP